MPENHQEWKWSFNSLLRLHIHAIIKETGQIYQREKYILNEEDVMMKLVRPKHLSYTKFFDFF